MTTIQYLKQYQTAHLERLSLLRRREDLRAKYAYPRAIQYSDMPKAHDVNRDLSDFAAKLMELEHLLDSKSVQCLTLEMEILCRIDLIKKHEEREVLRARYIDLDTRTGKQKSFKRIARELHYSQPQIFRIHRSALKHFPMPNDDSK